MNNLRKISTLRQKSDNSVTHFKLIFKNLCSNQSNSLNFSSTEKTKYAQKYE